MNEEKNKKDEFVDEEDMELDKSVDEENIEESEKETDSEEESEENSKDIGNKPKNSQEGGAKMLVIGLIVIVVGMIIFGWVISESRKVDYIGLTFTKENFGQIPIYTSPLNGQTINGNPINFKLALRGNPKESKVPVIGEFKLDNDRDIYLSVDVGSNLHECGSDALVNFGYFMGALDYNLQTAVTTKEDSIEYEKPYVICENTNGATVFILTNGSESKIEQQGNDDCYKLYVNNCELTEVMERLEITTLAYIRGETL